MLDNINPERIAFYFRTSTGGQDKAGTIRGQAYFAEQWAARQGVSIDDCRIYEDSGVSSSKKLISEGQRVGGSRLLSDCASGLIDVVCVYSTLRIGRILSDFHAFEAQLRAHGVRLIVMSKNVDNTTEAGVVQMGIEALFGSIEGPRIEQRMRLGREAKAALGSWAGGARPYGYKIVVEKAGNQTIKRLYAQEPEASHIRLIFQLYNELKSTKAVSDHLIERGIKSPSGNERWDAAVIAARLRLPRYKGVLTFNRKSQRATITGPCEALVTEQVWDRAQRILDMNNRSPQAGRAPQMLSGLARCAYCATLYHSMKGERFQKYRHSANMRKCSLPRKPYIRASLLEELVWGVVMEWLRNPGDVIEALKEELINEGDGGLRRNLSRLETELSNCNASKARLVGAVAQGYMSGEDVAPRIVIENEKISDIESEIARVRNLLENHESAHKHISDTESLLLMLTEEAELADYATRREIVNTLIQRVNVYYDTSGRKKGGIVSIKVEGHF